MLVLVSFPLVFSECGICWMAPGLTWVPPLYYALLIAAFQTGWATVQIAHLSLIPDLTAKQTERAELTAIRYLPRATQTFNSQLVRTAMRSCVWFAGTPPRFAPRLSCTSSLGSYSM